MARETINGISVPIPGTGEPPDFVGDLRRIATDLSASIEGAVFINAALRGCVADEPGDGTGTENRTALQAALDDAATAGRGVVYLPKSGTGLYKLTPAAGSGAPEHATSYGVIIPPGVTLMFEEGAALYGHNTSASAAPMVLTYRSDGARLVNFRVRGSYSYANQNGWAAYKEYRSADVQFHGLVSIDGTTDSITLTANPDKTQADTTTDFVIRDGFDIGPNVAVGPHLFGAHHRTRIRGKGLVRGTCVYDALQLEGPGAADASQDFYCEDLDVLSCAFRGLHINPGNADPRFGFVKVRNPGRLPDGTVVGYDPANLANQVSNSCVTVFGADATFDVLDVQGGLNISPSNQPAVSWSRDGYAVRLDSAKRVRVLRELRLGATGSSQGGDIYLGNSGGYSVGQVPMEVAKSDRRPVVVYGSESTRLPAPVIASRSTSGAQQRLLSLLPGRNVIGPDGAFSPAFGALTNVTSSIVTPGPIEPGYLRVTEATSTSARLEIPLDGVAALAKGGVAHLVARVKFDAPAPSFTWALGGLTARRYSFNEAISGRDYQPGVWRSARSSQFYPDTDTWTNNLLTIWWNYGATATGLDINLESLWLYVGTDPFTEPPALDYSADLVSAAVPTLGTNRRGKRVTNGNPAASGTLGWICVTAGTPGTWKTYGSIGA